MSLVALYTREAIRAFCTYCESSSNRLFKPRMGPSFVHVHNTRLRLRMKANALLSSPLPIVLRNMSGLRLFTPYDTAKTRNARSFVSSDSTTGSFLKYVFKWFFSKCAVISSHSSCLAYWEIRVKEKHLQR